MENVQRNGIRRIFRGKQIIVAGRNIFLQISIVDKSFKMFKMSCIHACGGTVSFSFFKDRKARIICRSDKDIDKKEKKAVIRHHLA